MKRKILPKKKLSLFINKQCNLRCRYCYWPEHPQEEMPEEISDRLISYIKQHPDKYDFIIFFGGEPMLSPYIIAKFMNELGTKYNYIVMTNGTIHPAVLLNQLEDTGCRWNLCFTFSYDGLYQMDRSEDAVAKIKTHIKYLEKTHKALYTIGCIFSPYHHEMIADNMIETLNRYRGAIFFRICDLSNSWDALTLKKHIKGFPKLVDIAVYYEVCKGKMVHMPNHIEISSLDEISTSAIKGYVCQKNLVCTDICGLDGKKYLCEPSYAHGENCYGYLWEDNDSIAIEWGNIPDHKKSNYHYCLYKQSQSIEFEEAMEKMRDKFAARKAKLLRLKEAKKKYLMKLDEKGRLWRFAENHFRQ